MVETGRGSAVVVNGGHNVRVVACTFRNLGNWAVKVYGGTKHGVVGCDIYYMTAGKIVTGEVGELLATATIGSEYVVGIDRPGDSDVDGDVDGHDFLVWQQGDYSPKGIPGDDLVEWEANFGAGGSVTALAASDLEPASVLLVLLGLGLLAAAQRRENRGI